MFDLRVFTSFILFLIKEKQKNIAQLFLHYNFFNFVGVVKIKNFLLIILNNLNSIYGPFLNKNFFHSIRYKTTFRIQNIELSNIHIPQKLLILFLNLTELKNYTFYS